jgi:tetratricopeptide (TPR) repeat protein
MLELNTPHLDDFTLLRYVAEDLDDSERMAAADHLRACGACQRTVGEIAELDRELKGIAANPETRGDFALGNLPEGDSFRKRPEILSGRQRQREDPALFAARAVQASEEGEELSSVILEAAKAPDGDIEALLGRVDLCDETDRFALVYALQKAGPQIAECPGRFLRLAERTILLLNTHDGPSAERDPLVETTALVGQAQQLAGQACLWTGDFERAKSCFEVAYHSFAQIGDDLGLAKVEQLEAQRRFFVGRGDEALILARRASSTAERLGVDDEAARGRVAEGLALQQLARHAEAVERFRSSLHVFEVQELWSNYVGAVNSMATSLVVLGRLGEARAQFAKALRRLSRDKHRSWLPFIRKGLAEVLFAAGRYREAAISAAQAARLYGACGMTSRSLMSSLYEIESWARAGEIARARHRLELFRETVKHQGILDPTLSRLIGEAFSGAVADYQKLAELRESAENKLSERLGRQQA